MAGRFAQIDPSLSTIGEEDDKPITLNVGQSNESISEDLKDPVSIASCSSSLSMPTSGILTNHIVKHYQEIQALELKLKEILDVQQEVVRDLSEENKRFKDMQQKQDFTAMFNQVSHYTKKLHHLRNEMIFIQERTSRLKQRAVSVKIFQERKVEEMRKAKALQEERERLLTAKPVWEVDQTKTQDKT